MIDSRYDEDLLENSFFQDLKTQYPNVIDRAVLDNWIICVPKADSFQRTNLTQDYFLTHILIPNDELPETHYRTLNGKQVTVSNRVITVEGDDVASSISTHIIFEEIFYTNELKRYKVWCVECLLNHNTFQFLNYNSVTTLRDCIDLLWTESLGKELLENLDLIIERFLYKNKLEQCSLQTQKDLVSILYTKCLQIALRGRLRERTTRNQHLLHNVKVSIESYVLHGIYKKLFASVSICTAYDDSSFNKTVRNLSDLQLRDLNVNCVFYDSIPCAKRELAKINGYSTVLGKLNCLENTLNEITKVGHDNNNEEEDEKKSMSTDDLLPIFVFLVLKTNVANWIANLMFLKQFQLSAPQSDESGFLVTTLEAAIEYIKSGVLLGFTEPEGQEPIESETNFEPVKSQQYKDEENVTYFFRQIRIGNYEQVFRILKKTALKNNAETNTNELCHPLCSCDKCERVLSQTICDTTPTVHSCDDRGFTALHIACMYGQLKIIELLLEFNASVGSGDYSGATPLHYAAMRGHQNALLLLLHSGAVLNVVDSELNTALHFCCNNGHDSCVKALLYFSEHQLSGINVNCSNALGNTPLHYASRWGYESIVQILLEYGAVSTIENKHKKTALDCALNLKIYQIIKNAKKQHQQSNVVWIQTDKPLDFLDESKRNGSGIKDQGTKPNSKQGIKRVELLLRSVAYGDVPLTRYYLGLEEQLPKKKQSASNCHPLCTCDKCKQDENPLKLTWENQDMNVCNSEGFTPLHVASLHGRIEIVKLLLENGAGVNIVTRKGLAALHLACQSQRYEIIKILLKFKECNVNLQDLRGNTPLHYSCYVKDKRIVKLLLDHGADPYVRNANNKTVTEEMNGILN